MGEEECILNNILNSQWD
uniref:Uncharacterized protein n=1 Tax=Anguilla anguilla TaxID=7936 RepID=A0A0E9XW23_ANGAN